MKRVTLIILALIGCKDPNQESRLELANTIESSLKTETLAKWYPRSMDTVYGGFLSTFTYDFKPTGEQEKMIVTQSRHTWTNARLSTRYPDVEYYKLGAKHGFEFLQDVMWDKKKGGFYQLVDRQGNVKGDTFKTAYGNSFGIYALAAYYRSSNDARALHLVKKAFDWLEKNSHDSLRLGYFQHLTRSGLHRMRSVDTPSSSDLGYKDQNSSIHLLEALTELYRVWPDPVVRERLSEMLVLIRDTIVTPKGHLTLFFTPDWKPVSFADSSKDVVTKHHSLDHVSFGHDIETAYLMLEASHVLGLKNDSITVKIAKRMVDHCLSKGWDASNGGFYDEGYYFKGDRDITITHDTKNWWAQAEALNTLLLMGNLYPDDKMNYYSKFETQWKYIDKYLIDHENGDWFAGGLDKQPELKQALKGHIWKAIYHHYRSMTNCMDMLRGESELKFGPNP
jgi:mannobiose 2-epimerase